MKQDVVDAGVAAVQAAEVAALKEQLGLAYDSGVSDAQGGGLSQADVDAAVQAVKDADAAILEAAKADFQAQLSAVQQALSDMTAKEQLEEAAVADVKAKIDSVQEAFDKIKAFLFPAPPPPVDPVPVDPPPADDGSQPPTTT